MKTPLLNIAVAECVLGWDYVPEAGHWMTWDGPQALKNWAEDFELSLDILEIMRDVYKLRAVIEMPIRDGANWWVCLEDALGTRMFEASGSTLSEAAVKAALKARHVFVD
jgi:hypothetical protein